LPGNYYRFSGLESVFHQQDVSYLNRLLLFNLACITLGGFRFVILKLRLIRPELSPPLLTYFGVGGQIVLALSPPVELGLALRTVHF